MTTAKWALVACACVVAGASSRAQQEEAGGSAFLLVLKAGAYVEAFQKSFGSMVAEERYEQTIRPAPSSNARSNRSGLGETVLRSDFLLVQIPGEGWLPFRDVFERDGKMVRDREERLAKLFLSESGSRPALDRAKSIMDEGARYNIGNVNRNINVPTLVLTLLTPVHRTRLRYELGKADEYGTAIEYKETSQPTYITTTGGRSLPVYGKFWVDEQSGTIRRTELHAVDTSVEAHITVFFEHDAGAGLVVPVRMEERYRRARDPNEVHGVATYSRFRRFQVSTSEAIEP
ncbi:MAG TPA: hypothetical protein VIY56_08605 [Vicinamibacterales bacterium]